MFSRSPSVSGSSSWDDRTSSVEPSADNTSSVDPSRDSMSSVESSRDRISSPDSVHVSDPVLLYPDPENRNPESVLPRDVLMLIPLLKELYPDSKCNPGLLPTGDDPANPELAIPDPDDWVNPDEDNLAGDGRRKPSLNGNPDSDVDPRPRDPGFISTFAYTPGEALFVKDNGERNLDPAGGITISVLMFLPPSLEATPRPVLITPLTKPADVGVLLAVSEEVLGGGTLAGIVKVPIRTGEEGFFNPVALFKALGLLSSLVLILTLLALLTEAPCALDILVGLGLAPVRSPSPI